VNSDQLLGPLRTLVPTAVAWVVAKYGLPASIEGPLTDLVVAAAPAVGAAAWSWASNSFVSMAAKLAAAKGTQVSGSSIQLVDPNLAKAAKEAATNVDGK
jgi:hypothetical protein